MATPPGALGLPLYAYYGQVFPFIDLFRQSYESWFSGTTYVGSDGWLYALPNGVAAQTSYIYLRSQEHATPFGYYRTGRYYLIWPGNATAVIDAGYGLANLSLVSPGRYQFEVTATDVDAIIIRVTNTSGANVNFAPTGALPSQRPHIVHELDESAYDAGDIFQPSFLDSLRGALVLRGMDWLATNYLGFVGSAPASLSFSDFPTESARTWTQLCPPSILGRLALARGVDLWVTIPAKCTLACMSSIFQAIYDTGFRGTLYVEYSNELWNSIFPSLFWVRDTKAAGLDVDGSGSPLTIYDEAGGVVPWASASSSQKTGAGMAHGALQVWRAAEAIFGESNVVRMMCGQSASFDNVMNAALEYIDPLTSFRMKSLVEHVSIANYYQLYPTATLPTVTLQALSEQKAYLLADAVFVESINSYIDNVNVVDANAWVAALAAKNPAIKLSCYEGGQHVFSNLAPEQASQGYSFTIDAVNNRFESLGAVSIVAAFDTGEVVRGQFNGNKYSSGIGFSEQEVWCRRVSTTALKVYPSQADANADTNAFTLDGAAVTYVFDNYARIIALDTKLRSGALDCAAGAASLERLYQSVSVGKQQLFMHFVSTGFYGYGFAAGGLKRSQYESDSAYPRAAWFRGLIPPPQGVALLESIFPSTMEPQTNPVAVSAWT